MRLKTNILFILLLAGLHVQGQQWHFKVDVYHAPEQKTQALGTDLLVVNNAVEQPADFGHAVKQDEQNLSNISIDLSATCINCLFAASQILDGSGDFASVSLLEKSQNTTGSFWQKELLSKHKVDSLCKYYGAEAVLSLEQLVVYDIADNFYTVDDDYYASLEVYQTSVWTLQYTNGKMQTLNYTDTLIWTGRGATRQSALAELPDRQTAILDMSAYVGEKVAAKLIHQWTTEDRYIYDDGSKEMEEALLKFRHQNWKAAIDAYEVVYKNSKKLTRAYAAADIAVAYEMMGEYKKAKDWADSSAKAFGKLQTANALQQRINMNYYKKQLNNRINE